VNAALPAASSTIDCSSLTSMHSFTAANHATAPHETSIRTGPPPRGVAKGGQLRRVSRSTVVLPPAAETKSAFSCGWPSAYVPLRAVRSGFCREQYERRSVRFVDARSMIDPQDDDGALIVVDLVDHPIRPSSCGVKPGKFALQTSADAMGVVDQGAQHELDNRSGRAFGESAEVSLRWTGDAQFVGVVVLDHLEARRARSSSPVM